MIDPATGWFELHQIPDTRSDTLANVVEQEWLCRYPWPSQITYDHHGSFIGKEFQSMIDDYGIKRKPITVRNPQANAICERVHEVIGNIIRTFELQSNYLDEDDPWKGILSATAFAIRCTYHTTLHSTPGQLVFGRDMIFNIQHAANWDIIRQHKQKMINQNNARENAKRIPHQYKAGDKVMLHTGTENKYEQPYSGPHTIINNRKAKLTWFFTHIWQNVKGRSFAANDGARSPRSLCVFCRSTERDSVYCWYIYVPLMSRRTTLSKRTVYEPEWRRGKI